MTVSKEISPISMGEEFRICPACGHNRGFHVSFIRLGDNAYRIVLICPECGARYGIDWNIEISKK
jgi:transcription elongation factor Elf1